MSTCAHEVSTPVEVRDRRDGGTMVVARICNECLDRLPAGWGCTDCEWVETRALCDPAPTVLPGTPCPRHRAS